MKVFIIDIEHFIVKNGNENKTVIENLVFIFSLNFLVEG